MVFTLGFLVSGLLTLLFLPAFWRRAVRLSMRRLEMQMPLSMAEIVAERDQLRAVFAAGQRQLEQKTEALQEARALDRGELGRRATGLVERDGKLAAVNANLASTAAELAERSLALAAAETEIGSLHQAHWDVSGHAESQTMALLALQADHGALNGLADERRVQIAGLETRAAGLEMKLEDLLRRFAAAENDIAEKTIALGKLVEERDFLAAEAAGAAARRDQLQAAAIGQNQRIADLERFHRLERRARVRFENEAAGGATALAEVYARREAAEAAHARQIEETGARERQLQQEIEHLRAETSALAGALDVTRGQFAALRAEREAAPAPAPSSGISAREAEALRQSIGDVGAEVARLAAGLREEAAEKTRAGGAPQAPGERVRELQSRAKRAAPIR